MRLRKICSALMLLVITSQIFASTIFTASEIVNYTNENETTEVSSDTNSQTSDTDVSETKEKTEGTSTARGLVSPSTSYNIKAEDFIVADVGNLRDGTASWNDEEGPGWDTGDKNGIVRTFDTVSYRVDFAYNNADIISKDVIIRAIAPEGDYSWQTASLIALQYDVKDYGNGTIDIRLPNVPAGSGAQTEISLFVGEQRHGDTFKPEFEFYLEDTDREPITVLDQIPETTVSAISSINVVLNVMGSTTTSNIVLDDKTYGRQYLGYELQLMKVPENGGTSKGMEIPDPTVPLEFNIDLGLKKTVGNTTTPEKFYIYDVGYNGFRGFLENTSINHEFLSNNLLHTDRKFPIISKKLSASRYLQDSGELKITQTNGEELAANYLEREYETLKFSFTNFTGIYENAKRNMRVDGSVPFASGGLHVISEIDIRTSQTYTLTYNAEVDREDNATFKDTNPNDNIANGVRTIMPIGGAGGVTTRLITTFTDRTADNDINGLGASILGQTWQNNTQSHATGQYIEDMKTWSAYNFIDPRSQEIPEEPALGDNYTHGAAKITLTDYYAKTTYPSIDQQLTRKYGVINFTRFGDIMDSKYYVGNPGTSVTTGGGTANIDEIEQFLLGLEGTEDEETIKWFDTVEDAKTWANANDGWYFSAFCSIVDLEPLNISMYDYSKMIFDSRAPVRLLNNEYTRYLFENFEPTIVTQSTLYETKEGSIVKSGSINGNSLAKSNQEFFGPFGYRKTVYDENGSLVKLHHSSEASKIIANSLLPLGAKPTIKKTVTKTDGSSLGSSSIVVPGIDEGVKWNIAVGLQSAFDIVPGTPLTVTDTVPAGLTLDESSIYPKTDPERGIEVKITTNANGEKVIQWIFTSELAREEFNKLSYVTLIDPMTENNITFTETATADFLLDQYQVASEVGILTQLRAGLTVQKKVNKTVIMPDEKDLEYTLLYRNMAGPGVTEDYKLYDVFPANTDGRDTTATGSMKLKNIEMDHNDPGVEIQYTFDEGRTNQDIVDADFKTEAEWTALGKNIEDATGIYVWLPNVEANVVQSVRVTFDTNGNSAQDLLVNNFRMSYEFNGTTFPLLSNTVMSSVPGITKTVGKTEAGPFGDSLMLERGEGSETGDDTEPDQYVYKLDVAVPKVKGGVSLDPFTVTDQIMPELDILNVKVLDETGKDITELNGDLTIDKNLVTYEFNNNLADINGQLVSIFIEVRVKATVPNFDMYPDGKLPNVASLNIIGEDIESPEVNVEIKGEVDPLRPTQKPDPRDPTIAKSILNKDMEDKGDNLLVNATDEFFYKVDFTVSSFTSKGLVNSFTVKDQIKPELDILEVVLLDVDGNDVTEQFKDNITTVDNLVSFNLPNIEEVHAVNRQSFSLLIKVATTPGKDFSAYPDGKLPNIAILDVNDVETETDEVTAEKIDTLIKKIVTDEDGDNLVSVGETLTYTIEVSNPTDTDALEIAVRDSMLEELPSYVKFNKDVKVVGSKSSGKLEEGSLVLENVLAKDKVIITYSITVNDIPKDFTGLLNVATDNGEDPIVIDPDICDEVDCDETTTEVEEASTNIKKTVADASGNNLIAIGEVLTYTLEVSNPTGNNAYDVAVRDSMLENLPSFVTFGDDVVVKGSEFTGKLSDGTLVLDKVVSKETVTITYSITVNDIPKDVTELVNIATDNGVDPETVDPDTCDEVDCDETTTPVEEADTNIKKSVVDANGDKLVVVGETLTYTLEVSNPSENHAYDVIVRDSMIENLPTYMTFNDDVAVEGSTYTGTLTDGTLSLDKVVSKETVTITYTVTVNDIPKDVTELVNIATDNGVDPDTVDPDTCDETDCDEATIETEIPDTHIKKTVDDADGLVTLGETLTYTIEVSNPTKSNALKVAVRDSMLEALPEFVTFNDDVAIEGSTFSGSLTDGTLVLDNVVAGETVTITYSITVKDIPKDVAGLLNVATDNGEDPTTVDPEVCDEIDCDSTTTPINGTTTIKKTVTDEDGDNLVSIGETLTYTLEITNVTTNTAHDVVVRDSMLENTPSYITFNNDVEIVGSKSSGKLEEGSLVLNKIDAGKSVVITYTITIDDLPKGFTNLLNIATDNGEDPIEIEREECDEVDCDETTNPVVDADTHIKKTVVDANGNGLAAIGEVLTYTIEVSNPTGNHAYDVAVRDSMLENLPSFVTFGDDVTVEGSEFSGSLTDGTLVLDKVATKESVVITYSITIKELSTDLTELLNIVTDTGVDPDTVDPDTCDETDCDSTETPLQGETKITKAVSDANGNGIAEAGEVLTYTLTVENYTIHNAVNVVVRDSMVENTPSWLTFGDDVTIERSDITFTGSLADANLTFYSIAPSEIVTITYTMTANKVLPKDEASLTNIATDNGDDPDVIDPDTCTEDDDCAETTNPVNATVEMEKSVSDANGNGKVDSGEVLTYTIEVFNPSNEVSAVNVIIRDSMLEDLPAWLTYNDDVTVDPADIEYTGSLTDSGFKFMEIASQQKVTITYTMTAADKLPTDIPFAINLVTSNGIDPLDPDACEYEDACDETVTPLQGSTTIAKKLVDESGDGIIQSGEKLNYTIAVTNVTNMDATNIVVRDSMLEKTPVWLTYNEDMKLTEGIKYSGDLTTTGIVIDTIKAGETVEITYSMTVANPIPSDVTQVVNIATDNGQDPSEIDPDGGKSTGEDSAVATGLVDTISQLQFTGDNIIVIVFSLIVMLILSVFIKRRVSN